MSGYQGKRWIKPEDRGRGGGAPKHPDRSANDTVRRGGGESREASTPFLTEVTAQNMEKYIAAVHQFTLQSKTHDALAPWIRGRIPEVMLEHPLPRSKEKLIGLAARHNILKDGTVSIKNLTAMEVRFDLITKTLLEDLKRADEKKSNLQTLLGDQKGEIGSSSMDAESNPKDKRVRGPSVGSGKDLSTKTGSSLMDAGRSAKDPATEREDKSEAEEFNYEAQYDDAVRSIWPNISKKTRENERGHLQSAASSLLGLMVYAWPSKEIQVRMLATKSLMDAFESNDIILFIDELKAFALAGTGNAEANRQAAEKHLEQLVMKPGGALEYFKEFTEAVEHVRVCGSSFTELRVVDLFFRHLDQESFPKWWARTLTTDDTLHKFRAKPFEEAREHAKSYFDTVIRVVEVNKKDNKRNQPNDNNNKSNPINNMRHLKAALADSTSGPITVNPIVLATLISGNKRTREEKAKADNKAKADALNANADGTNKKKLKFEGDKTDKKICFKFRDEGKCQYGSECYFSHVKA